MIFCEKKQSSSAKVSTKLQTKLDADLKKQQAAAQDEESCCKAADKLAWVTKQTECTKVGMTKTMK